jgi:hypothetical protein
VSFDEPCDWPCPHGLAQSPVESRAVASNTQTLTVVAAHHYRLEFASLVRPQRQVSN